MHDSLSVEPVNPDTGAKIRFRTGVHFGTMLVGNFGSVARFNNSPDQYYINGGSDHMVGRVRLVFPLWPRQRTKRSALSHI